MATKKSGESSASSRSRVAVPKAASNKKPVALTVKVNHDVYVRLCTQGATQRRTHQDIMREAVEQFLEREGM
jgi:hypothetical protein